MKEKRKERHGKGLGNSMKIKALLLTVCAAIIAVCGCSTASYDKSSGERDVPQWYPELRSDGETIFASAFCEAEDSTTGRLGATVVARAILAGIVEVRLEDCVRGKLKERDNAIGDFEKEMIDNMLTTAEGAVLARSVIHEVYDAEDGYYYVLLGVKIAEIEEAIAIYTDSLAITLDLASLFQ